MLVLAINITFNNKETNTADRRHDPEDNISDGECGGIESSIIGNIATTCGSGAEPTSTISSVVGSERPETGNGNRVSVDPGGYPAVVI